MTWLIDGNDDIDDLFGSRAQREGFRRCLEGLLLPPERNKTLTALADFRACSYPKKIGRPY